MGKKGYAINDDEAVTIIQHVGTLSEKYNKEAVWHDGCEKEARDSGPILGQADWGNKNKNGFWQVG